MIKTLLKFPFKVVHALVKVLFWPITALSRATSPSFLKWLTVVAGILVGCYFAWWFQIFQILIDVDVTRLTLFIFSLFVLMSIKAGMLLKSPERYTLQQKTQAIEWGEFWCDAFQKLGMVGTLVGLILVLSSGLGDITPSDPVRTKQILAKVSNGLGVAFYTTLVGLVCSFLLDWQYKLVSLTPECRKMSIKEALQVEGF